MLQHNVSYVQSFQLPDSICFSCVLCHVDLDEHNGTTI